MNVNHIKECLTRGGREELMIPYIDYEISKYIFDIALWAMEGKPQEARQVFFCIQNAVQMRNDLPPQIRCRIVPITPEQMDGSLSRGPYHALLLPHHGFMYSDPNLCLNEFWVSRGQYKPCEEFQYEGWTLWFWASKQRPLKLFGMDHHHAVLWDMKQILRPLGIQVDFTWLCDGRPPINEAIPGEAPPFHSSLDIYKKPVAEPLQTDFQQRVLAEGYDGIITSHSLITAYRLSSLGLPLFHVNSTRFGNEWVQDSEKHNELLKQLEILLQTGRLRVFHNNRGDQMYFRQFFPRVEPNQEMYIPSLCESPHRLRLKSVEPQKFLVWDTRQVLLQQDKSPFMKRLYSALAQSLGVRLESQAILLAQTQNFLAEGYLDNYTAVIHLPYNVSTMSIFQQTRANIPVWVPSKQLLETLWADANEPNELSWTVFAPDSEAKASWLDHVREPSVVKSWTQRADFYYPKTMGCICTFDSVEDLVQKIITTDYQAIIDANEKEQGRRRQEIYSLWEQAFQNMRMKQ